MGIVLRFSLGGVTLRQVKPVRIAILGEIRAGINGDNIIITDVRQPNEAHRLQARGFKLIKVIANKV